MTKNLRVPLLGVGVVALAAAVVGSLTLSGNDGQRAPTNTVQDTEGIDMAGMDMGGSAADGSIGVTPRDINTFGITFGEAEVRSLQKAIRTVGLVDFDETRMAYVAPKFGGWAERLYVSFTGEPVREGDPLLEVYSPELITAQEELLLAARMAESVDDSPVGNIVDGARDLLASAQRRLRYWDISGEQIQHLLQTGEVRRTLTLYAPVSGIVMEKSVLEGQAFRPGENLYMIADLSQVWVNAEVFEADVPLVREGMLAEITVDALPGERLVGSIEYVYPTLADRTRSMRARVSIRNPGSRLKPGMYTTVNLTTDLGDALTVPTSAVLHTGERAVAFIDMGSGRLMPHELRLGAQGEGYVQVLEGLEPGDRVVTSTQFLLDSESNLAEVMRAMMAQMNLSDMGDTGMEGMDMGTPNDMDGMQTEDAETSAMEEVDSDTTGQMNMSNGRSNMPGASNPTREP